MITEQQENNIYHLPDEDKLKILRICASALSITDMENASKILNIGKRRIYQRLNDKNSIQLGIHKFPAINLIVKDYQR